MKDYTPYDARHALPAPRKPSYNDIRDQFVMTDAERASTLVYALHARTRELDAALTRVAILEAQINYYESDPLRVAWNRLEATGASLVFVGEIRAGETPRIQASGELLAVLETLGSRLAMFGTQVVELNVNETKKAS